MINAGELRHTIELYSHTSVSDEYGGLTYTDDLFRKTKAKKETIYVKETNDLGATVLKNRLRFTIRWSKGINSTLKIKYRSEWYDIISYSEDGIKRFIQLTTEKQNK